MAYDGLDRLTHVSSPMFGTANYGYDPQDNLTSVNLSGGSHARQHDYCYNTRNQLEFIRTGAACSGTTSPAAVALGYDVQGNVSYKNGSSYSFDYGNRLRSTGTWAYRYDAAGRRVRQESTGAGLIDSVYAEDGRLLWQRDEVAGQRINNVYIAGSLLAEIRRPIGSTTATISYFHTDALGSPIAKTNAAGTVIETSEYEPYGALLNRANDNRVGYTGHVMDSATGLTYMQQRYYDPAIGRFLSVDPVTAYEKPLTNFNRYAYAFNNPYWFTDPDGREAGCMYGPSMCGMREVSPEVKQQQKDIVDGMASFIPGVDLAGCAKGGCSAGGWIMAGMAAIPGDGKAAQIGTRITRASLNRVKALVKALSRAEAKAKPLTQGKAEKLERIVEKAGGTLRNDGDAGVKGSSAGTPHVQTEGLGNKTDSRHVWTEPDVKLKNEK